MNSFPDHFSKHAALYAAARPTYPISLYAWILSLTQGRERAWDCATGNGQAAVAIAEHFEDVVATDASASQIEHAQPSPRVRYMVASAESVPLDNQSVDLVTVAQAYHWFERDRFESEVRRVLRPGGAVVIWGYAPFFVEPAVDAVLDKYLHPVLAPHWPLGVRSLWDGYVDVTLPFTAVQPPELAIQVEWSRDELLAYLLSWSGAQRALEAEGEGWVKTLQDALLQVWPDESRKVVTSPLVIAASRRLASERPPGY